MTILLRIFVRKVPPPKKPFFNKSTLMAYNNNNNNNNHVCFLFRQSIIRPTRRCPRWPHRIPCRPSRRRTANTCAVSKGLPGRGLRGLWAVRTRNPTNGVGKWLWSIRWTSTFAVVPLSAPNGYWQPRIALPSEFSNIYFSYLPDGTISYRRYFESFDSQTNDCGCFLVKNGWIGGDLMTPFWGANSFLIQKFLANLSVVLIRCLLIFGEWGAMKGFEPLDVDF